MPDSKAVWTKFYAENSTLAFPPEGLIRILKGSYPSQKMPRPRPGQLLLDIGCGDGSAFPLYQQLGLKASGTEITNEIRDSLNSKLFSMGIFGNIFTGLCNALPFENSTFDYIVSWNSCYYMSLGTGKIEDHVAEMARVLKPDSWLICSVPTIDCFIFDDVEYLPELRYVRIISEHFGLRSGEIMYKFNGTGIIELTFGTHFTDFSHAEIDIDWFGLNYCWHVFTARKRTLPVEESHQ